MLRDHRYVLANLIIRARDGRLVGMGHFTPASASIEKFDKKSLISSGKCDNLSELAGDYQSACYASNSYYWSWGVYRVTYRSSLRAGGIFSVWG